MEAGWDGDRQRIGPTAACHENEIADSTRPNRSLGHHDRQAGRNRAHFGKRSDVGAGRVPFVLSLGDFFANQRGLDDRIQLNISRDRFGAIASALDAARGRPVSTALGGMLSEYIRLLERRLPALTDQDAQALPQAIAAMVAACVARQWTASLRHKGKSAPSLRVALICPCAVAMRSTDGADACGNHRGDGLGESLRVFVWQAWQPAFKQPDVFREHSAKRRTHR